MVIPPNIIIIISYALQVKGNKHESRSRPRGDNWSEENQGIVGGGREGGRGEGEISFFPESLTSLHVFVARVGQSVVFIIISPRIKTIKWFHLM